MESKAESARLLREGHYDEAINASREAEAAERKLKDLDVDNIVSQQFMHNDDRIGELFGETTPATYKSGTIKELNEALPEEVDDFIFVHPRIRKVQYKLGKKAKDPTQIDESSLHDTSRIIQQLVDARDRVTKVIYNWDPRAHQIAVSKYFKHPEPVEGAAPAKQVIATRLENETTAAVASKMNELAKRDKLSDDLLDRVLSWSRENHHLAGTDPALFKAKAQEFILQNLKGADPEIIARQTQKFNESVNEISRVFSKYQRLGVSEARDALIAIDDAFAAVASNAGLKLICSSYSSQ